MEYVLYLFDSLWLILYKIDNAIISYNNSDSSSLSMETEVKQGSVLSASLLTLWMENLMKSLLDTNAGCMEGSRLVNTLLYADDIVLIAPGFAP